MMPRSNPIQIPSHLRGNAEPDTLAGLVRTSRRMEAFWPLLATAAAAPTAEHGSKQGSQHGSKHGFRVSAHDADLVRDLSEYGA
jgi:hypothetical protein